MIAAAMLAAALLPGAASAKVRFVGDGGPANFGGATVFAGFDFTLPDFVTATTTATPGADGTCGFIALFGGLPVLGGSCTSATFNPAGTVTFANLPGQFDFGAGSFQSYGTYVGTLSGGPATLTVSAVAAPGAPAPLLGLGLLPALAAGGGLIATRRRRRALVLTPR